MFKVADLVSLSNYKAQRPLNNFMISFRQYKARYKALKILWTRSKYAFACSIYTSLFNLGPSINGLVTDGNTKLCCRGFIACGALAASICVGIVIPSSWSSIYCGRPWPAAYINFNQNIHQIQVLTKPLCRAQAIFYSLPNNEWGTKYRGLTYSTK